MERIVKTIIEEIDEEYTHELRDYRGRTLDKEFVLDYFCKSYYRMLEIVKIISPCNSEKKVLDIGGGYGFYDIILKEQFGFDTTVMEIKENISSYSRLLQRHSIPVIPGMLSRQQCPVNNESFDIVIFSEVIEHLRVSPLQALLEINRILRPQGKLVLTTPNIARFSNILNLCRGRNIVELFPDEDDDLEHITDTMVHIREYTMGELTTLMQKAGFRIAKAFFPLSADKIHPRSGFSTGKKLLWPFYFSMLMLFPFLRGQIIIVGEKPPI